MSRKTGSVGGFERSLNLLLPPISTRLCLGSRLVKTDASNISQSTCHSEPSAICSTGDFNVTAPTKAFFFQNISPILTSHEKGSKHFSSSNHLKSVQTKGMKICGNLLGLSFDSCIILVCSAAPSWNYSWFISVVKNSPGQSRTNCKVNCFLFRNIIQAEPARN